MASSSISNTEGGMIQSRESKCKRPGKICGENRVEGVKIKKSRWRTPVEQNTYSQKLIEALRRACWNQSPPSAAEAPVRARAIRETADGVLAVAAKGKTRWSRAMIASRIRMKLSYKKHKKAKVSGGDRCKNPEPRKRLPVLVKKMRVLGRLVPGCRKASLANLLEETTDYIAALEMQVRAMAALAGLLDGAPISQLESTVS